MRFIETEKNGMQDLEQIIGLGKGFRMNEKKFFIMFILKTGGANTWSFDTEDEYKVVLENIRKELNPVKVDIIFGVKP